MFEMYGPIVSYNSKVVSHIGYSSLKKIGITDGKYRLVLDESGPYTVKLYRDRDEVWASVGVRTSGGETLKVKDFCWSVFQPATELPEDLSFEEKTVKLEEVK